MMGSLNYFIHSFYVLLAFTLTSVFALDNQLCVGEAYGCFLIAGQPHCWGVAAHFGGLRAPDSLIANGANEQAQAVEITGVSKIFCGPKMLYALTAEGSVVCHGFNSYNSCPVVRSRGNQLHSGQIKFKGATVASMTAQLLSEEDVGNGVVVVAVAPFDGYRESACYLFSNQRIKCMGYEGGAFSLARGGADSIPRNSMNEQIPWVQFEGNHLLVTQLSCGRRHCVTLQAETNRLIVWGYNLKGQLGLGTDTEYETDDPNLKGSMPTEVNVLNNEDNPLTPTCNLVTQLEAKRDTTCILCDDEQVRCWGANDFYQVSPRKSELYDPTETNVGDDSNEMNTTRVPDILPVGIDSNVTRLSLVRDSTCVEINGNGWKCFGRAVYNGRPVDSDAHTGNTLPFANFGSSAVVELRGSRNGITCFSTVDGDVKCFGVRSAVGTADTYNANYATNPVIGDEYGEMGDVLKKVVFGKTRSPTFDIPLRVAALEDQFCVGNKYGCLLVNGQPNCWGDVRNFGGITEMELVFYDYDPSTNVDYHVGDEFGEKAQRLELFGIAKIFCGDSMLFGLTNEGSVVCSGSIDFNACALGANIPRANKVGTPLLVYGGGTVEGNMTAKLLSDADVGVYVTHIATGTFVTCYLFSNHKVKCKGDCSEGKCGVPGNIPNAATGDDIPFLASIVDVLATQLSCGLNHCCVVTLGDGLLVCWGGNEFGQLGVGPSDTFVNLINNEDNPNVPICTNPKIHTGMRSTCVLCDDHQVRCWGLNYFGIANGVGGVEAWGLYEYEMGPTTVPIIHPLGEGFTVTRVRMIHFGVCFELDGHRWKCMGREFTNGLSFNTYDVTDADFPNFGDNNESVLDLRGGAQLTCFTNFAREVRCFGKRSVSGTSDWYAGRYDNDEYIGDSGIDLEMGDALKKVQFPNGEANSQTYSPSFSPIEPTIAAPTTSPSESPSKQPTGGTTASPTKSPTNLPISGGQPANACRGKTKKKCKKLPGCRFRMVKVGNKKKLKCA